MGKMASTCLLLLTVAPTLGQAANPEIPASCKVLYSMTEEDTLQNINQGLLASGLKEKDGLKWLQKMYKKYPDVCYVAPNTRESVVFVIIETPAVRRGTRVESQTNKVSSETTGTITDNEGNTAHLDADSTGTKESSVTVPYEVNYNYFTLAIERKRPDGHFEAIRRFRVDDSYVTAWGRGKHPITNVMEDAIAWIHRGGLNNPAQAAQQ